MAFDLSGINWLAVIVAAVIYFVLGAAWYAPMFLGKAWQRSIGWDTSQAPPQVNPMTYVIPGIAYLVISIAVALIAKATGTDAIGEGIVLGVITGVGFGLAPSLVAAFFTPQAKEPMTLFAITGAYNFIGFVILSVIIAVWR